jgi:hypothetical protein
MQQLSHWKAPFCIWKSTNSNKQPERMSTVLRNKSIGSNYRVDSYITELSNRNQQKIYLFTSSSSIPVQLINLS